MQGQKHTTPQISTAAHAALLALILCLLPTLHAHAQRRVIARADAQGIWVRWTSPDLKGDHPVHIYRQDAAGGPWTRITQQPLAYGQTDLAPAIAANPSLQGAKDIADGLRKANKMEGIGLALVLTEAVQSREFSAYLGIIHHDRSVQPGKAYIYEAKEATSSGEISYGITTPVEAGKFILEKTPQDIKTLEGDTKLSFTWTPDEQRLTGANIYAKTGGANPKRLNQKVILPSKVPSKTGEKAYPQWLFTADSLQNGTTYTCTIRGMDLFGFETEPSEEFKLTPRDKTPPATATDLSISAVMNRVTLTWKAPKGKDVQGIHIYRQKGADTTWVQLTKQPLPPTATHYDDIVEEGGTAYTYTIATTDKAGNQNRTTPRFIDVKDLTPPVQVRNLKAIPDTGVIKLAWFPNPDKDLQGYRIYRIAHTPQGGDTIQLNARVIKYNAYNDTLPKVAKNQFTYFVTAIDTNYNESIKSAAATAILPDPEPPQTPTLKAIRKEGEGIKIVWLPGLDIDLAGYIIYRSTKEKGPDSIWKPLNPKPLSPRDTAYTDRAITPGTPYYYTVQALDNAGNHSTRSAPFMASVTTIRLKAVPQELQIKHPKGKTEATLTWNLPPADGLIGAMVYRRQGKDPYLPVSGLLQESKFTDKGLKKGQTYQYEVRAFDKVGNFSTSAPATLTIEAE